MADQPADPSLSEPLVERLVGFGRYLRRGGFAVGTGRIMAFVRAVAALDPFDREDLQLAARATLVSRPEDFEALDAALIRYFSRSPLEVERVPGEGEDERRQATRRPQAGGPAERIRDVAARWSSVREDEKAEEEAAIRIVASDVERLRHKDFGELTPEERRKMAVLLRRLAVLTPLRPSRRYRRSHRGQRFDLRQTMRASLRTEGEPFRRAWRRRQSRQRALVLILDVSGSMAPYSRALLEFAQATAMAGRKVEVFVFGTRLTRVTRVLRSHDPDKALSAVGEAVVDWEGGTRIGDSLRQLLSEWSARSALRGSVVVLCSDGLERGAPDALAYQMERLSRLVHRLVWVNPLKGSPRYEPLARGMAASLPFVDVFLPCHNLESLEDLAGALRLA